MYLWLLHFKVSFGSLVQGNGCAEVYHTFLPYSVMNLALIWVGGIRLPYWSNKT